MSTSGGYTPTALPECPYAPRMTRAAALALRGAGGLLENCVVVITDGPVIGTAGNTSPTEIELNPVSATQFGLSARVNQSYDDSAWMGEYDIDLGGGTLIALADNRNNFVDDPTGVTVQTAFPWHNTDVQRNIVRGPVTLTGWDAIPAGSVITDNLIHNAATINLTGLTSVLTIDGCEIDGNLVLAGSGGIVSLTKSELHAAVTRNAAATGQLIIGTCDLQAGSVTQNAGATVGRLNLQRVTHKLGSITQNGPGVIDIFDTDIKAGTIVNAVGTTRALNINVCTFATATIANNRTTAGVGADAIAQTDVLQSTIRFEGAAGAAGAVSTNGNRIQGNAAVIITDPSATGLFQNSVVEQQGILNLNAGGSFTRSRLSGEATLNTAFLVIASIMELQATKTTTADNVNRLCNKAFDDWL